MKFIFYIPVLLCITLSVYADDFSEFHRPIIQYEKRLQEVGINIFCQMDNLYGYKDVVCYFDAEFYEKYVNEQLEAGKLMTIEQQHAFYKEILSRLDKMIKRLYRYSLDTMSNENNPLKESWIIKYSLICEQSYEQLQKYLTD